MHRVVITGVGVQSAAGAGFAALVAALREGRSCLSPLDTPLPVRLAGQVPEPVEPDEDFPDDRKAWLAFAAAEEAIAAADLDEEEHLAPERRRAVFLGTGLASVTPGQLAEDIYPHLRPDGTFDREAMARDLDARRASPRRHMPGRVTAALARRIGAEGPTGTSFSACAAAAQAIAEGFWALRRGQADLALVGGHDAMIHPLGILSFVVLGAIGEGPCRPFDRRRDGFAMGEGAAVLVLETLEHARARGATVLAEVLGAGTSADGHNPTAPHPEGRGAEAAMRAALADARLEPERVDYVNAHGTGTPLGDRAEALAVTRVFGPDVRISSIKGAIGHTVAAAGALEAAACVAALRDGFLPGTAGLEEPDPDLPLRPLRDPVAARPRVVLSNSFGFGGQNCALLLGAPEGSDA